MKQISILVAVLAGSTAAFAQEESPHVAAGSVALATDYLFRGISQTDNSPSVQGSLEYNYTPWGIYLGAWASNVDNATSDGEIEIDWYGGFRGEFSDTGIGWDLGAIYYHYPGDDERLAQPLEADYVEAKAGLSYKFLGVPFEPATSATVYWSPDYYRETGDAVYLDGSLGLSLPYGLGLGFHVGYQDVDDLGDYIDWRVGLSREVLGFGLDVSYWNAENEPSFCGVGSEQCGGTVLGTISRKF
ncbi:MAG: TorF family putative porin [Pseudomonadota bacterium]|nr:TorF family putative porin [Pseudomonadota bacterium]